VDFAAAIRAHGCSRSCATPRSRGSSATADPIHQLNSTSRCTGTIEENGLEADTVRKADGAMIRAALNELMDEFGEVIVMRDIEGLSYKEIADAADLPSGPLCRGWLAAAGSSHVR
jgi:DNA-directed RNA polymerase specialized sigma24 family protein